MYSINCERKTTPKPHLSGFDVTRTIPGNPITQAFSGTYDKMPEIRLKQQPHYLTVVSFWFRTDGVFNEFIYNTLKIYNFIILKYIFYHYLSFN